MKRITLLLLICCSLGAAAQKDMPKDFVNGNFKVTDRTVIWEKIYISDATFKDVVVNLKMTGLLDKPEAEEPAVYGQLIPFHVDYKAAGATAMGTKPYITSFTYKGFASIKKLNGGYVVTIKKLVRKAMLI
ncbi:hypothetical protein LWM68_40850 [Niabella sp. W65]|nr:hypothetical protein [Niabella sp. W65]MCH7368522.1 hypothetical protein [Niabella sp. W65]ULT44113.1 hypothetical protein KRR40_12555 [Niabella sp. I65]